MNTGVRLDNIGDECEMLCLFNFQFNFFPRSPRHTRCWCARRRPAAAILGMMHARFYEGRGTSLYSSDPDHSPPSVIRRYGPCSAGHATPRHAAQRSQPPAHVIAHCNRAVTTKRRVLIRYNVYLPLASRLAGRGPVRHASSSSASRWSLSRRAAVHIPALSTQKRSSHRRAFQSKHFLPSCVFCK